ncbi:hypothetical protein SDC9_98887 [bioreactor metagenome]|uniref:DUF6487 domain-containing protein n=1 Tax=bioreactor metagenome TaxID=1076179 RepID=A0A645AIM1_9ZZZZ|nr:PF20097 family protein [Anaerotignum propionicum]MEA5057478.1 PF20097 family protein [Anaerotignum propionicum]
MKCPYCNHVMKRGHIQSGNLLSWTPEGESSMGVSRWSKSPNSIVLANCSLLSGSAVDAFYCPTCKKIIINVDNQNEFTL